MIIYVVDGGYGPGPGQMAGAFPAALIVLLTVLAWMVSRALFSRDGETGPATRRPRLGATGRAGGRPPGGPQGTRRGRRGVDKLLHGPVLDIHPTAAG